MNETQEEKRIVVDSLEKKRQDAKRSGDLKRESMLMDEIIKLSRAL